MATNAAAQNAIKKKLVHKLEVRCWARICKGQASAVSEQGLSRSPHTTPLFRGVKSFSSTASTLRHREISLPLCALCCFGYSECLGATGVGTGEVVWGIWALIMVGGLNTDCQC